MYTMYVIISTICISHILKILHILESAKSKRLLYTKNTLPRVVIFSFFKICSISWKTVFHFGQFRKNRNSRLSHLSEDHQCWVILWNLGICRHAWYTSEQALIIRLYLRRELSIISILSFIHNVQDDLPQVSLNL